MFFQNFKVLQITEMYLTYLYSFQMNINQFNSKGTRIGMAKQQQTSTNDPL